MKLRVEVFKLGPAWLVAQEDGTFWCAQTTGALGSYYARFRTHAAALAHALAEAGLTEKNTEKEN